MNINDLPIPIPTPIPIPKFQHGTLHYTTLSTLPGIYNFLTQRVVVMFLVVLSMLHKLVNRN